MNIKEAEKYAAKWGCAACGKTVDLMYASWCCDLDFCSQECRGERYDYGVFTEPAYPCQLCEDES